LPRATTKTLLETIIAIQYHAGCSAVFYYAPCYFMFQNQKTLSNRYTRCLFLLEPAPSFSGEISFVFLNRLFTLLDFLVGAIDPLVY